MICSRIHVTCQICTEENTMSQMHYTAQIFAVCHGGSIWPMINIKGCLWISVSSQLVTFWRFDVTFWREVSSVVLNRKCFNTPGCRAGLIPLFQNRYRSDSYNYEYLPIPISIRYLGSFFFISVEFLYLSVRWPAHHSFVFYTESTQYRYLYCKEKQQINEYVIIIIYNKNTFRD